MPKKRLRLIQTRFADINLFTLTDKVEVPDDLTITTNKDTDAIGVENSGLTNGETEEALTE